MMKLRYTPALWFMAGALVLGQASPSQYHWQSGWNSIEIETSGHVEFTDDDADVKNISSGGYFKLEQRAYGSTKTFVATSGPGGEAHRSYSANGATKPLDADAKAWLAQTLTKYIRESAINASARVQRIRSQRGDAAVLFEIGKIESDGSRRIYLSELLGSGNLQPEDLREAMRQARKIASDGEKATLLAAAAQNYRSPAVREDYFYTVDTISSDGEHRRVLSKIIEDYGTDREMVMRSLKSARRISSDGEKAGFLVEAATHPLNDEAMQNFFRASDSINSDGEHHRVLSAIIRREGENKETLGRALRSAATISSDGDKTSVLVDAAGYYSDEPPVRKAFFDAVGTISSDGEHRLALEALLKRPGLGIETLRDIAQSAARISSDGEKGAVLSEFVSHGLREAAAREGFFNAANSISSDGERAQVLIAALSAGNLDKQGALQVVASARGISSDGEKAKVVGRVVEVYRNDADVSMAVRKAAETIGSDGEYRRVMSLLAK